MSEEDKRKMVLYAFNIIMEAKIRALTIMIKKHYPEWNKATIKEVLSAGVDQSYEKDHLEDVVKLE
jgi:hypothetical protein